MKIRKPTVVLLVVLFGLLAANAQESCQTPKGLTGTCIVLTDCNDLFTLLKNTRRTMEETKLLRDSQCGQQGRNPKVCCPPQQEEADSCTTPNFVKGTCTNIYKCPAFIQLLNERKPLKNVTLDYLASSKCTGPAKYNVCCKYPNVTIRSEEEEPDMILNPDQAFSNRVTSAMNEEVTNMLPSKGKCGEFGTSDRIIGGEITGIDDYPWMALIEYRNRKNETKLSCAGSLITERYVLTAAHCVHGSAYVASGVPINIRLGEYDKRTGIDCVTVAGGGDDCNDEPITVPIETIIVHEEYDPLKSFKNDLALIRMKSKVKTTYFVNLACLPTEDFSVGLQDDRLNLTVAGWGTTEKEDSSSVKLHLPVPYVTTTTCQRKYGASAVLNENQLCAGGARGKDSCKGDSGGPLMHITDDAIFLVGVVSFGPKPCAVTGTPGVYTKVFRYMNWIRSHMKP